MFEKQNIFNLHENKNGSFKDPKSWLSNNGEEEEEDQLQSHSSSTSTSSFDRVLYKNLIEVVPLVESLMDQKSKTSFTRRAQLVYTKTPTKEGNPEKAQEPKGKKTSHLIPAIKQSNNGDNKRSKDGSVGDVNTALSKASALEKDKEQLDVLQEQVRCLHQKLLEKDELLKSAETSMNHMALLYAKIDELKRQVAERESLIKAATLQLSDVNAKLAEKQAAVEQIQLELSTSKEKVEELEDETESIQLEKAAFLRLFEDLMMGDCTEYAEDCDSIPSYSDQLPCSCIDDTDEKKMQEMEAAREDYISALASAKESQDEKLLAIAAQARLRLQTFVLRSQNVI